MEIRLHGDVDLASHRHAERTLVEAVEGATRVVVDLSDVPFSTRAAYAR